MFANLLQFWEHARRGTRVETELSGGRIIYGVILYKEIVLDDFFVDICIEIDQPGTYAGDSGALWKTSSGLAVAVHCKGAGNHPDGSSLYSLCMSAHRMQEALNVEFKDV